MTGPHDSVIGVRPSSRSQRMRTGMPSASTPPRAASASRASSSSATPGRATRCEALRVPVHNRADEHRHERDQHEVAREHEPRRRAARASARGPSSAREPELRQHERRAEQPARRGRGGRATSGTSGISQTRNCGESTLPKATNAVDRGRGRRDAAAGVRAPAREPDPEPDERPALDDREPTPALGAAAGEVLRPVADPVTPVPTSWCAASRTESRGSRSGAAAQLRRRCA